MRQAPPGDPAEARPQRSQATAPAVPASSLKAPRVASLPDLVPASGAPFSGRPLAAPAAAPWRGIALMLMALAVFSGMDGITKHLTSALPPLEVALIRYAFHLLFLVPLLAAAGPGVLRSRQPLRQGLRGLCMLGSGVFFIIGLTTLPIAQATAIGFASPLMVAALVGPLLGEAVGLRRWAVIALGFAGVLMVVRPGTDAFVPAAIWPILSAVSWAFGLIITRRMRDGDPPLTTAFYTGVVGVGVLAVLAPWQWRSFGLLEHLPLLAVAGAASALGQYLMVRSLIHAPASLLAPTIYSQLLWSSLIGWLAFETVPDDWTWIGATVIIASGFVLWRQERQALPLPAALAASGSG